MERTNRTLVTPTTVDSAIEAQVISSVANPCRSTRREANQKNQEERRHPCQLRAASHAPVAEAGFIVTELQQTLQPTGDMIRFIYSGNG